MTGKAHEANETTKRTPVVNRKFKDTVFRMLFSDKEALLSLYNAVNNSHYTDSGALEIVTLENAIYVAKVRSFAEQMPLDDAVQKAVTECIQENILADFLKKNQAEVIAMSIFEYDEKAVRQVYYEDGLQAGRKDGIKTGILNILRAKKYSLEEISEVFQVPVEEIEQIKKQQI